MLYIYRLQFCVQSCMFSPLSEWMSEWQTGSLSSSAPKNKLDLTYIVYISRYNNYFLCLFYA